jgi:hypothetical protein
VIAAIWKNDLRHWLIWINFVVFGALIVVGATPPTPFCP